MTVTATNLEPLSRNARPVFLVPADTTNVAAGKTVSASNTNLSPHTLSKITDTKIFPLGDDSCVEVGQGKQWVQIDLAQEFKILAVLVWHCYAKDNIFFDVVVQISPDANFQKEVTTIYNNDADNTLGLGAGMDRNYYETYEGKLIDAKGAKGRYVRLYSNGNTRNLSNQYMEIEVHGRSR